MEYIKENQRIWDERSENNDIWSIPVTSEQVKLAREGNWQIVLTPTKPVPDDWFPEELKGKKLLCLAGGGG
ncbi:MAG: SAM-dependent methyltransferase, partial [Clostridia bacterium]|nr:SAM-dependent methyltransferase [Clostridia bacterium]